MVELIGYFLVGWFLFDIIWTVLPNSALDAIPGGHGRDIAAYKKKHIHITLMFLLVSLGFAIGIVPL